MKLSRNFGCTGLFSNDLYISIVNLLNRTVRALSHIGRYCRPAHGPGGPRVNDSSSHVCEMGFFNLTARVRLWTNCRRRWEIRLDGFS